jgi:response regulator RpfG family c-di-GMP phosphodiesterase
METARAIEELRHCAGTQFDPSVVEAFAEEWRERERVRYEGVTAQ